MGLGLRGGAGRGAGKVGLMVFGVSRLGFGFRFRVGVGCKQVLDFRVWGLGSRFGCWVGWVAGELGLMVFRVWV